MAIKETWNALIGKNDSTNLVTSENSIAEIPVEKLFPVISIPETTLNNYHKVPIAGLAALGAAFTQLPETARTIISLTTSQIATNETLFVGINPKGVAGYLLDNGLGTSGNIMRINEQGKQVIVGRMRFKALDTLPINETTSTIVPFDPTLMVIAMAVIVIEQKLDKIQESVDKVLLRLELDTQATQRGNLRKLTEIAQDYKAKCNDAVFCENRNNIVQEIQVKSLKHLELYQEKIAAGLKAQKALHLYCSNFPCL